APGSREVQRRCQRRVGKSDATLSVVLRATLPRWHVSNRKADIGLSAVVRCDNGHRPRRHAHAREQNGLKRRDDQEMCVRQMRAEGNIDGEANSIVSLSQATGEL